MDVGRLFEGRAADYEIVSPLGEGAFSITFLAEIVRIRNDRAWFAHPRGPLSVGTRVVIKLPKIDFTRSALENRARIHEVTSQLMNDFAALQQLRSLGSVAKILDHGTVTLSLDSSAEAAVIPATFLVEEHVDGLRFDHYLARRFGAAATFAGIPAAKDFFALALAIARIVRDIHQARIVHGDIWYTNIIMRGDDAVFIDFGSSLLRDYSFRMSPPRARDPQHGFYAPERRGGAREGRRSDIYALGGLLFFMATGADPFGPIRDDDVLKNTIIEHLRDKQLFAENCGIADIIARCLRYDKDRRIANADTLIHEIRTFAFQYTDTDELDIDDLLDRLTSHIRTLHDAGEEIMQGFLLNEIAGLVSRMNDTVHGVREVSGDHEAIASGMCESVSTLHRGDILLSRSIPQYWSADNLGINGRFLAMNKLIAQHGVTIRRIFLLCDEDRDDPVVQVLVAAHRRVMMECSAAGIWNGDPRADAGGFATYVRIVSKEQRARMLKEGWHVDYIVRRKAICVEPVYDTNGVIRTVRFLSRGQVPDRLQIAMDEELALAWPLDRLFAAVA